MPPESEWTTDERLIEFYKRMERQDLPNEYDSTKLGNAMFAGKVSHFTV